MELDGGAEYLQSVQTCLWNYSHLSMVNRSLKSRLELQYTHGASLSLDGGTCVEQTVASGQSETEEAYFGRYERILELKRKIIQDTPLWSRYIGMPRDLRIFHPCTFPLERWNFPEELERELFSFACAPDQPATRFIELVYMEWRYGFPSESNHHFNDSIMLELQLNYETRDLRSDYTQTELRAMTESAVILFPCLVYCFLALQQKLPREGKGITFLLSLLIKNGMSGFINQVYPVIYDLFHILESSRNSEQLLLLTSIQDIRMFKTFFPSIPLRIYEKDDGSLNYKWKEISERCLWSTSEYLNSFPYHIMYLLRYNAMHSRYDIVEYISREIEMEGKGLWSQVLHIAAKKGSSDIVRLALKKGGTPHSLYSLHSTLLSFAPHREHALKHAIRREHVETVRAIVESPVYDQRLFEESEGITALCFAVEIGNIDIIHIITQAGHDVNKILSGSNSPLNVATEKHSLALAEVLLSGGADPNIRSGPMSYTPLHIAAFSLDKELIKLLIDNGAHTDTVDRLGDTPIAKAFRRGNIDCCKILLEGGADASMLMRESINHLLSTYEAAEEYYEMFKTLVHTHEDTQHQ